MGSPNGLLVTFLFLFPLFPLGSKSEVAATIYNQVVLEGKKWSDFFGHPWWWRKLQPHEFGEHEVEKVWSRCHLTQVHCISTKHFSTTVLHSQRSHYHMTSSHEGSKWSLWWLHILQEVLGQHDDMTLTGEAFAEIKGLGWKFTPRKRGKVAPPSCSLLLQYIDAPPHTRQRISTGLGPKWDH